MQGSATVVAPLYILDFRQSNTAQQARITGAAQFLAINAVAALGGSGNAWSITWCWSEEVSTA
jgi:hypothetical protein